MFRSRISGLGIALPQQREELGAVGHPGLPDVSRLTGIERVRVSAEGEDSRTLAQGAARRALAASGRSPESIDLVIYAGITRFTQGLRRFRLEPSLAETLASELGARHALCLDLTNACAGAMTAIHMADLLIGSGDAERVLVVTGEYLRHVGRNAAPHVDRWDHPELASLTLGDAGAAVCLEAPEAGDAAGGGFIAGSFETLPEHADLCVAGPAPRRAGGTMRTDAATIHIEAIRRAPVVMERSLDEAGLPYAAIDLVIPHQTSIRAIRAGRRHFAEHFGEDAAAWGVSLSEYGNTATCTHFIALAEAIAAGTCQPNRHIMFLVFASGLVVGSLIYRVPKRIPCTGAI